MGFERKSVEGKKNLAIIIEINRKIGKAKENQGKIAEGPLLNEILTRMFDYININGIKLPTLSKLHTVGFVSILEQRLKQTTKDMFNVPSKRTDKWILKDESSSVFYSSITAWDYENKLGDRFLPDSPKPTGGHRVSTSSSGTHDAEVDPLQAVLDASYKSWFQDNILGPIAQSEKVEEGADEKVALIRGAFMWYIHKIENISLDQLTTKEIERLQDIIRVKILGKDLPIVGTPHNYDTTTSYWTAFYKWTETLSEKAHPKGGIGEHHSSLTADGIIEQIRKGVSVNNPIVEATAADIKVVLRSMKEFTSVQNIKNGGTYLLEYVDNNNATELKDRINEVLQHLLLNEIKDKVTVYFPACSGAHWRRIKLVIENNTVTECVLKDPLVQPRAPSIATLHYMEILGPIINPEFFKNAENDTLSQSGEETPTSDVKDGTKETSKEKSNPTTKVGEQNSNELKTASGEVVDSSEDSKSKKNTPTPIHINLEYDGLQTGGDNKCCGDWNIQMMMKEFGGYKKTSIVQAGDVRIALRTAMPHNIQKNHGELGKKVVNVSRPMGTPPRSESRSRGSGKTLKSVEAILKSVFLSVKTLYDERQAVKDSGIPERKNFDYNEQTAKAMVELHTVRNGMSPYNKKLNDILNPLMYFIRIEEIKLDRFTEESILELSNKVLDLMLDDDLMLPIPIFRRGGLSFSTDTGVGNDNIPHETPVFWKALHNWKDKLSNEFVPVGSVAKAQNRGSRPGIIEQIQAGEPITADLHWATDVDVTWALKDTDEYLSATSQVINGNVLAEKKGAEPIIEDFIIGPGQYILPFVHLTDKESVKNQIKNAINSVITRQNIQGPVTVYIPACTGRHWHRIVMSFDKGALQDVKLIDPAGGSGGLQANYTDRAEKEYLSYIDEAISDSDVKKAGQIPVNMIHEGIQKDGRSCGDWTVQGIFRDISGKTKYPKGLTRTNEHREDADKYSDHIILKAGPNQLRLRIAMAHTIATTHTTVKTLQKGDPEVGKRARLRVGSNDQHKEACDVGDSVYVRDLDSSMVIVDSRTNKASGKPVVITKPETLNESQKAILTEQLTSSEMIEQSDGRPAELMAGPSRTQCDFDDMLRNIYQEKVWEFYRHRESKEQKLDPVVESRLFDEALYEACSSDYFRPVFHSILQDKAVAQWGTPKKSSTSTSTAEEESKKEGIDSNSPTHIPGSGTNNGVS